MPESSVDAKLPPVGFSLELYTLHQSFDVMYYDSGTRPLVPVSVSEAVYRGL